jgi:hypothetical protein
MGPTIHNLIVGYSTERSALALHIDSYIRVSDEERLRVMDSMSFGYGWTELDLVDEPEVALDKKKSQESAKGEVRTKNQGAVLHDNP